MNLFEGLGYSPRCEALTGTTVEIAGYVVDTHDGRDQMLVAEPGGCPHCSPVPAICSSGLSGWKREPTQLAFAVCCPTGFTVDGDGAGSFLRLENGTAST